MTTSTLPAASDDRPVFGYVRVSTDRQETERQEHTIPLRHTSLPDGLASNPLELFCDDGISGYKKNVRRPDFDAMRARIESGEASALIIDTSSRLTRQGIRHALSIFFTLQDANCRLFTTQGREYTFDVGGIISLIVDAESDERYSATLSHNISSGKAAKARDGRWHHGDVGPGYRFDKDSGELIDTEDLPLIADAFRRFNERQTYKRICAHLTDHLSGEALSRLKHQRVDRDRLRAWLSNPIYAGIIQHRGERFQGKHPAAVDLATFEHAQRRLRQHAADYATREPRSWPFSGIAKCGYCRRSLRLHPVKNRHGTRYYYTRCSDPDCSRQHKAYTAAAMEANLVLSLAGIAQAVELILTSDADYGIPRDGGPSPDDARAALDDAKVRVKKLGKLIADEALDDDDPDYLAALRERDAAQAAFDRIAGTARSYRDELAALAARVLSLGELSDEPTRRMLADEPSVHFEGLPILGDHTLPLVLAGWQQADFDRRREVIEESLEAVYVSPEHAEFHFRSALPQPLITSVLVALHGRDDDTPDLEAAGYGRPFLDATPEGLRYPPQQQPPGRQPPPSRPHRRRAGLAR